jgi:hypothetical protein
MQNEKTTFQQMHEQEKREFVQNIINLLNCTQRACDVIANVVKLEQEYCKQHHIHLANIYP